MNVAFVVLLTIIIAGCKKSDTVIIDIPNCVKDKIDYYNNSPNSYINKVDEFLFQGKLVYVFSQDGTKISDAGAIIINNDCSSLCFLGGIAGISTCNGDNFSQKAILQRVIWKK